MNAKWRIECKTMINKVDGNNPYTYTKPKKVDIPDTGEKFNLGYQKKESSSGANDKSQISEQEKQQALERSGVRLELSVGGQAAEADRRKQAEAAKTQNENASARLPLLETIRTYIMAAITAVREFFHTIWNDQPPESASQDSQQTQEMQQEEQLLEGDLEEMQWSENISEIVETSEGASKDGQQENEILQDVRLTEGGSRESEEIIDTSDEASVLALEEERRNREIQQSLRNGDMKHVISLLTDNGRKTIAKNSTLLTSYDKNGRVVEPNASDRERALYGDKNTWTL